jgi:hypothetical protein
MAGSRPFFCRDPEEMRRSKPARVDELDYGRGLDECKRNAIPMRQFGRHNVRISALGLCGHHWETHLTAHRRRPRRRAVDGGITFFDIVGNIIAAKLKTGWEPA